MTGNRTSSGRSARCAGSCRRSRGRAFFALAVVDPEIVLEIAERAVGAAMIAQRRAAGLDRVVEHRLDGVDQRARRARSARRDGRRWWRLALRRQQCAMQRLADIDVAEPRDDALIEQRRLQAGVLAGARLRQHGGVERVAERLGAERAQQRLVAEPRARHQLHRAEPARIVEADHRARTTCGTPRGRASCPWRARGSRRASSGALAATRNEPDMPRCITSTSPEDRSASRYLARRPSPVTVWPFEPRRRNPSAAASAGRGGRASTLAKRAPSIAGARPRRTVSTSGSSGMSFPGQPSFRGAARRDP